MSYQVEMCDWDEITDEEKENFLFSNNGCGKENATYLRISRDGVVTDIRSDAMEVEDANFYRSLRWVHKALIDAYNAGVSDGQYEESMNHAL